MSTTDAETRRLERRKLVDDLARADAKIAETEGEYEAHNAKAKPHEDRARKAYMRLVDLREERRKIHDELTASLAADYPEETR